MWRPLLLASAAVTAMTAAAPAFAQTAAAAQQPVSQAQAPAGQTADDPYADNEVEEVVVTATRQLPGAVPGDIPPEISLSPREIRGLGVSSVAELLDALAPQLASNRGRGGERPVTLVNGARISSFAEIRDLPPEAILRVDILPEEVALQYGYRADQRVINFVLRPRFRAVTTEVGVKSPTQGGRESVDGDLNVLRIRQNNRLQIDIKASKANALLESERDIQRQTTGAPYSVGGLVTASPYGGEIDPALSAAAGQSLTVAGLPAGLTGAPTLQGLASASSATTSLAPFRTLSPSTDDASVNAILSRAFSNGVSATANARLEKTDSESRLGLGTSTLLVPAGNPFSPFSDDVAVNRYLGGPLLRRGDELDAHLGVSANGAKSGWRWSFTSNADRTESRTLTDTALSTALVQAAIDAGDPTVNPFATLPSALLNGSQPDYAKSVVTSGDANILLNGTLKELPAGGLTVALNGGVSTIHVDSESVRSGVSRGADLSRDSGSLQASFDLPITSRRNDVFGAIGNLSANLNLQAERLSDFGTLTTVGGGLNWSPIDKVRILTSYTREDGAPTVQQLGDPEVATPAVRVFDYVRGETVEVTQISGGNPFLTSDNRQVVKVGFNFKPYTNRDLTFRADYTATRIRDSIATFPAATAQIEAAFPERFVRDASGRLVSIDTRAVNFAREEHKELRWGLNYTRPIGPQRPAGGFQRGQAGAQRQGGQAQGVQAQGVQAQGAQAQGQAQARQGQGDPLPPPDGGPAPGGPPPSGAGQGAGAGGPPGGGFGGGGFGGGGFRGAGGRGGFGGGSIQFAVFHTIHLQDEILIRDGVPVLDLLNGSAASSTGGGQPRHEVDVQAGYNRNGYGARLTAHWQSATDVNGGLTGSDDLHFSDLTTVNLRLFADLGLQPIARRHTWLRGARVNLQVDNLFDARQEVRTAAGVTPISYQPDLIDPLGRTVRLSFRKVFF